MYTHAGTLEEFGFGGQGVTLDTADEWTMVLDDPFTEDGEITGVEFYAGTGAAGRPLRVGIYRPTANTCQFILKQQIELSGIVDEHNLVILYSFVLSDRIILCPNCLAMFFVWECCSERQFNNCTC